MHRKVVLICQSLSAWDVAREYRMLMIINSHNNSNNNNSYNYSYSYSPTNSWKYLHTRDTLLRSARDKNAKIDQNPSLCSSKFAGTKTSEDCVVVPVAVVVVDAVAVAVAVGGCFLCECCWPISWTNYLGQSKLLLLLFGHLARSWRSCENNVPPEKHHYSLSEERNASLTQWISMRVLMPNGRYLDNSISDRIRH